MLENPGDDERAANARDDLDGPTAALADGHVDFEVTPYCGMLRLSGMYDNIYTAGNGDGGTCDDKSLPVDERDSVLLPTDDPGGK